MKKVSLSILPNLITLGNAVCGFAAIIKVSSLQFTAQGDIANPEKLVAAAWLILLAMVFDALDGSVARMTKSSSDFGGELDSLSDIISFGVAPAVLVAMCNSTFISADSWGRAAWVFSMAFLLGAVLRLARFNVENSTDESAHQSFEGLPSPAAAGTIVTLVLCAQYLRTESLWILELFLAPATIQKIATGIPTALPIISLILAYLMVSRVPYVHVFSRMVKSKNSIDQFIMVIFAGIFLALIPEVGLAVIFVGYTLVGPFGKLKEVFQSEEEAQEKEALV